jgi:manganese-dependent inorganic pyrophosphatase
VDKVFVTGHINPDLDCTVASFAYAWLKNKIDPNKEYIPVRCGALNTQTKEVFKSVNLKPPKLYKNLSATVGDVTPPDFQVLHPDTPILEAVRKIYTENISMIPVVDEGEYIGSVSVNDISAYVLSQNTKGRPTYSFNVDNFDKVLPGHFLKKGKQRKFKASLIAGAMPFEGYKKRFESLEDDTLLVVGNREDVLTDVAQRDLPGVIITGLENVDDLAIDLDKLSTTVYISDLDTAESLRLLRLSVPVRSIVNNTIPRAQWEDDFDEVKRSLLNSEFRGMPVFQDNELKGVVTRRRFIEKPSKKLIMVDHNELHHSIPGANEAEILEIIDHHRFGAEKTKFPIYIASKPVGSSSTIVYQHFRMHGIPVVPEIAKLLLSGVISDTVNLKSPTSTEDDRKVLDDLCSITGINPEEYALELFSQLQSLKERDPHEVILSDFKMYSHMDKQVGIGQVEVITFENLKELYPSFKSALQDVARDKDLDWSMLLITDVMKQDSILISYGEFETTLMYTKLEEHVFDLPNILSRKKQLLPEVIRVVEEYVSLRD